VDAGINTDRISRDFIAVKGNAIHKILETALTGNFGTIVVGRREVISFTQEHFRAVSVKKSLNRSTIWQSGWHAEGKNRGIFTFEVYPPPFHFNR
jgi:hypothetical protein